MEVRGRRLFNRRPVCFFALFLAFGIIVAEGFYALPHLYRLIPLLLTAAVCVIFAAKPKLRGFLCLAVAFLTGFVSCSGAADVYDSRLVDDVSGTFTARVSGEIIVEDGTAEFYVEDLAVNGEVLEGECRVYVPMTAPDFGVGDVISIRGELVASRHEAFDSYFSSNALNGTYLRYGRTARNSSPRESRISYSAFSLKSAACFTNIWTRTRPSSPALS